MSELTCTSLGENVGGNAVDNSNHENPGVDLRVGCGDITPWNLAAKQKWNRFRNCPIP